MVPSLSIESGGRNFGEGTGLVSQVVPQLFRAMGGAREPTGHANDGNGLVWVRRLSHVVV